MEEPQEKHEATEAPNDPDVVAPFQVPIGAKSDDAAAQTQTQKRTETESTAKPKPWLSRLFGVEPDRQTELLLALAITFFAAAQWITSCQNNASTSTQVNRLITAADRIDDAADSFSRSASGINRGVSDAVGKLQSQVDKMDASRKSADRNSAVAMQTTIDSFHREERAWIGISKTNPLNFTPNAATQSANMVVAFTLRNYGRSAAENVRFIADLESDPTIYSLSCDEANKIHAGMVLLPTQEHTLHWTMNLTSDQITKGWSHQNPVFGHTLMLRIVGCIEYTDRDGENPPHSTPFSYLVMWPKGGFITLNTTVPGEELSLEPMFENVGSSQVR
ncbi:MAG TPA: hypothetical protein VL346_09485 [Acidobacteriaceae bacterium]|jgi:hypothetical protein|nr:hypothetical protein [Acidobacteriaceae bacterium]